MLPMILGFLGSAFAPAIAGATGIAALASPLLAGAIGSGLGSFAETGDLKQGIKTGLGSFVGGKLLGGLMGSTAGSAATSGMAPGAASSAGSSLVSGKPLLSQLQAAQTTLATPKTGLAGLFGQGAVGQGLKSGMNFMGSAQGIGSQIGAALAAPTPTVKLAEQDMSEGAKNAAIEMKPIPRQQRTPPAGYRPGIDPEFNYGLSTPYSYGDILAYRDRGVLPYAEGGEVKQPNEKTEIVDAISAIKGQHPQPEIALGKFVAKYGEEALRDLVDSVQSGEFDDTRERFANGENGMVRGPGEGSGVDDKVPATIDGEQDVLLADGEFVLRKDATDALEKKFGGGFLSAVNGAGKDAPKVLKERAA
jgi:hypothetical protein